MKYVNTHEAKSQLSKLIAAVRDGEEVVICQAGKPVARLTAFEAKPKVPLLGMWEGKVKFQPGWDLPETDAEIMAMFDVLKEPEPALRLLIDSNAFIWMVSQPRELSAASRHAACRSRQRTLSSALRRSGRSPSSFQVGKLVHAR